MPNFMEQKESSMTKDNKSWNQLLVKKISNKELGDTKQEADTKLYRRIANSST
jgi:hypothetical protein